MCVAGLRRSGIVQICKNPDVGNAVGWPPHTSVEEGLEIIRMVFSAPERYAVVLKSTGEPVGACGMMFDDTRFARGEAEIGYWMGAILGKRLYDRGGQGHCQKGD